jgi:hypothetical protein
VYPGAFSHDGEPFAGFESAEDELGWRVLRTRSEAFALNEFNSWMENIDSGQRLRLRYRVGTGFFELEFLQEPGEPPVMSERLSVEQVGRFVVFLHPPGDRISARFLTGEQKDGKPIVATVYADGREQAEEFIKSLVFSNDE